MTTATKKTYADTTSKSQQWWEDNFYNKVRSIAQLKEAILQHADVLGANGAKHDWQASRRRLTSVPHLMSFEEFTLRYSPTVRNSHYCPVGGVTNWGGNCHLRDGTPAPKGYPGLEGRFNYTIRWEKKYDGIHCGGSDLWKDTRIHTGSGGGGATRPFPGDETRITMRYGYDFRVFFDDWPALASAYKPLIDEDERLQMMHILKNGSAYGFKKMNYDNLVNELYPADTY